MSADALAFVFRDVNRTGGSALYELPDGARYRRVDRVDDTVFLDVSSASLFNAEQGCALVMVNSFPILPSYNGTFLQISNPGKGSWLNVDNLGSFDDATTTMLLVGTNRGPETRLSFKAVFLDKWNTTINGLLEASGSDVNTDGDPILTWEMFPSPSSLGLNSDLTYLKIFQVLQVRVHIGPAITYHYKAAIAFWIFLYVNSAKQVKGTVVAHDVWVSGGFYHDAIYNSLRNEVALRGVPELNARIAAELAPFSTIPLLDLYYLPGNQSGAVPSVLIGSTTEDVTIVLQRE